jgi:hypothetical protein
MAEGVEDRVRAPIGMGEALVRRRGLDDRLGDGPLHPGQGRGPERYLLLGRWAEEMVETAEGIDEHTRHKAEFYLRQLLSAYSPSNFVMIFMPRIRLAPPSSSVWRRSSGFVITKFEGE